MTPRSRALVAFVASAALVVASGVAWAATRSSGVGLDVERVTASGAAADGVASRGPQRPVAPAATDLEPAAGDERRPGRQTPDIPVMDATDITIPAPVPAPRSLRLPSVDVTMPVIATGVARDGQMELPDDPSQIGWYRFGAAPGDRRGSAVLAGHVDSIDEGAGPLARLASVSVGERVVVTDGDGARLTYRVTDVQRIAKAALPVDRIFRPDGRHRLVIVTCGGRYLPDAGGYEDNIVVSARPVGL
jgi:sortase (surface protein transpeptidase)